MDGEHDILLLSDTPAGLKKLLSVLYSSATKLGLTVNLERTKVVVFRNGDYMANHEKWFLGSNEQQATSEVRDFSLVFSTKLSTKTA